MKQRRGYALATILILLGVCMFGAAALVTISVLESRISRSQLEGTVAYYAAEAGVTDAVWRLNTVTAYNTALAAGTLNVTYTATNQPVSGQGFSVTMVTGTQGAGYADISVVGTSDNGNFIAQRRVQSSVFMGSGTPISGNNAILSGLPITVTNGNSVFNFSAGDLFSRTTVTINQATVSGPGQYIKAVGNYVANSSAVTVAGINAANFPPAPMNIAVPGYNFAQYTSLPTNKCTSAQYASQTKLRCTPAQFQALIGSSSNFNFPNQVVYIDAAETMNSWAKNKTLTFNGLLVVNGAFTINGSATGVTININDPGSHLCGLLVAGNVTNSNGNWNVKGVLYSSGSMIFSNPNNINVRGAIVAGGASNVGVSINTGASMNLIFDPAIAGTVLGSIGGNTAVQVLHWEEEY